MSGQTPTLLAAEYGPDAFGGPGRQADWADVEEKRSSSKLDSGDRHSTTTSVTPTMPLGSFPTSDSLFSMASNDSLSASPAKQVRRQSRHARNPSLSTKRESMEMMGGLGFPSAYSLDSLFGNNRVSRQLNFQNRQSGIQAASVLFGGASDPRRSVAADLDWRRAFQYPDNDGMASSDDRLTALEKLEGKSIEPLPASIFGRSTSDQHLSQTAARRRSQTQPRPSSVQLPSFDDIHGSEGIDKPSSTHLLAANERTTLEERGPSSPMPAWLAPPASPGGRSTPDMAAAKSPKIRPPSVYGSVEPAQPEGLGTLVEEEEEDDSSVVSPTVGIVRADVFDTGRTAVEDEEAQRRRKEVEEETIKRTRRSSLQPRPLKLKSRPASLFVPPSMQQKLAFSTSPSLEGMSELTETNDDDVDEPSTESTTVTPKSAQVSTMASEEQQGQLAREWSMTAAQARNASPTSSKPGMRALRLGSQAAVVPSSAVEETSSSVSDQVSVLARRRASLLYNHSISGSNSSHDDTMSSPATPLSSTNSRRRSAMMYKPTTADPFVLSTSSSGLETAKLSAEIEELKTKNLRDAEVAESLRSQIESLTSQMAAQSERASTEYSRLEQWSAEEKQMLEDQSASLEVALAEKVAALQQTMDALAEAERTLQKNQEEAQERMEDLEAERDMLVEDVDGWRTRCGDLEKSLKTDRAALEGERASTAALQIRLQVLTNKLREAGVDATGDALSTEEQLGLSADLMTALKTPASFDAGNTSSSSYFSPRITASDPPPQAVKLLKDMRQQIFNLAGSLEHERKEHIEAQKLADDLKAENQKLKAALEQGNSQAADSHQARQVTPVDAVEEEQAEEEILTTMPSPIEVLPSSFSMGRRPSGPGSKNMRHVFAYDSSMGSVDQSNSSMGSGATSMTSMMDSFAPEDKEADECGELSDKILPPGGLQPLLEEEEVAPTTITEEAKSEVAADEEATGLTAERMSLQASSISNFDLEAGGEAGDWADVDEEEEEKVAEVETAPRYSSDADGPSQYASTPEAFQTPAMEPSATFGGVDLQKTPTVALNGRLSPLEGLSSPSDADLRRSSVIGSSSKSRSAGSSLSNIDIEAGAVAQDVSSDESDEAIEEAEYDEEEAARLDANRPEFIRDWSFQEALHAVKARNSGKFSKAPGDQASKQGFQDLSGLRRRKPRQPSIDDFFGLLLCEKLDPLPPLPTTYASLDMPPVYVEHYHEEVQAPPYGEAISGTVFGRRSPSGASTSSSGSGSGVSGTRQPSIFGFGTTSKSRPPVARSAYIRDSVSSSSSGPKSSTGSGRGSLVDYSSSVALGSTAIARMSLQSLSSAFSGLGGYLAGQSGAAVHAAAAATTMCSKSDYTSDSRNLSMSWTVQPSRQIEGLYGEEGNGNGAARSEPRLPSVLKPVAGVSGGAKRYSSTPMSSTPLKSRLSGPPTPRQQKGLSQQQQEQFRSASGQRQSQSPAKVAPRRFISREHVTQPYASPIWSLDFSKSTESTGAAEIFSI